MNINRKNQRHAPQPGITSEDLADIARQFAEIISLRRQLSAARLRAANLEAAINAALGAHEDGESDPLAYLRDEIADNTGGAHGA